MGRFIRGRHVAPDALGNRRRSRRGRFAVAALAIAIGTTGLAEVVGADTTVSPSDQSDGATVVRDQEVTINVSVGGRRWHRSSGTANYAPAGVGAVCKDATSPFSAVEVKGPGGDVVFSAGSPTTVTLGAGWRGGPWSTTLDLTDQPPGEYTVTTTISNRLGQGLLGALLTSCPTVGTPTGVVNGTGTPMNTSIAGVQTETTTFVYRPWQHVFRDFFAGGSVSFNTAPEEFTFAVNGHSAPVVKEAEGAEAVQVYSLPSSTFFTPPADPAGCVADPAGCLPPSAVPCDGPGCTPRLAVINWQNATDGIFGIFDLDTRAFVALADVGDDQRVLASGGAVADDLLRTTYDGAVESAAQLGINLPQLLAQPVTLRAFANGRTTTITVSLLEGLSFVTRPTATPASGSLVLGAGLIVHVGTWSGVPTQADGTSGYGYTVQEAGILPAIPSGLPAPANLLLTGGKVRHVVGKVPADGGTHIIAIGASTEPSTGLLIPLPLPEGVPALDIAGFPATVGPVTGLGTGTDSGVEFIGDDLTVLQFELCLGGTCLVGFGTIIGSGVALFPGNPLDQLVSIGEIPALWNTCVLGIDASAPVCPAGPIELITQIDGQLADVAAQVLGNAEVQDALASLEPVTGPLLDTVLAGLPA